MLSRQLRKVTPAFVVLTTVLTAGCTTMQTGSSCVVDDAYFTGRQVLAWSADAAKVSQDPTDAIAPVTLEQIKVELERQLTALGYRFVTEPNNAAMTISFVVATHQQQADGSYFYYEGYWWGGHPHPAFVIRENRTVTDAYLAVDLTDARSGRALWRGWAQQAVTAADRRTPAPLIAQAVSSILAHLPQAALPQPAP